MALVGQGTTTEKVIGGSRGACFFLQILYLLGAGALAGLYFTDNITPPRTLGSIPIGVLWFGAVGAILLSLSGIFEHYADWLPSYRYWHWARPAVGGALAVISVLIMQAGILAINQNPVPQKGVGGPNNLLYYLVGFLVGYREETFRTLVKRLTDVVLGPSGADTTIMAAVTSFSPESGPVAGGQEVTIGGSNLTAARSVLFGTAEVTAFDQIADAQIKLRTPAADSAGEVRVLILRRDGSAIVERYTYEDTPDVPSRPPPSEPEFAPEPVAEPEAPPPGPPEPEPAEIVPAEPTPTAVPDLPPETQQQPPPPQS